MDAIGKEAPLPKPRNDPNEKAFPSRVSLAVRITTDTCPGAEAFRVLTVEQECGPRLSSPRLWSGAAYCRS